VGKERLRNSLAPDWKIWFLVRNLFPLCQPRSFPPFPPFPLAQSTMFSSTTLFSNNRNVQRARPLGGSEQARAISGARLAAQHGLEALFHQLLAHPLTRAWMIWLSPPFASFRDVRLQQDPRLQQAVCGAAPFPDHRLKQRTFAAAQPHNIFLYDNFLQP
jgi:hypothetical protein